MADAKQDVHENPAPSRLVLAKPRLGGFGASSFNASGSKTSNPFGSVLRPPQLKPTLNSNPFVRVTSGEETKENVDKKSKDESNRENRLKELEPEPPKFVPLGSNVTSRNNNSVPSSQPVPGSSAGFVFGQNLSERVVMKDTLNNGESTVNTHSSSNGTTTFLFTNAAATVKENNPDEQTTHDGTNEGLAAAAAEYERSHARPPPPTTNCITTGEEGESNVLQISCRLFAWEGGSWRERGRVVLRLNDANDSPSSSSITSSRLVARVVGSLRLVLNTKLWPEMVLDRAGNKSLRISAMDAQHQVKLFLIMGIPADISQLHRTMLARIANSKQLLTNIRSQDSKNSTNERLENSTNNRDAATRFADNYVDSDTNEAESFDKKDEEFERINAEYKTGGDDTPDDSDNELLECRAQKRKDSDVDDKTSPKRQCPDILID